MTIAQRFADALAGDPATQQPGGAAPELLPVRLARACAAVLPVDGAGLSTLSSPHGRWPLGGSDAEADLTERLQFTAGGGPCVTAAATGRPVFAMPEDIGRRWPAFAALLTERTRYRAVVALPFRRALAGVGALDLYLVDPAAVPRLDVFDTIAVSDLVTTALGEAAVWSTWTVETGPEWLHGPAAVRRSGVWRALGRMSLELDLGVPSALDLLRSHATATGSTVDDVAHAVLTGALPADLLTGPC